MKQEQAQEQYSWVCDVCDFAIVDPEWVRKFATVPDVTCRCGAVMRRVVNKVGKA